MNDQAIISCPCGSGKNYQVCCAPLLRREKKAETAEQLMRSRYCAFHQKDPAYLLESLHPSKQSDQEAAALEKAVAGSQWLRLEILTTEQGLETDQEGYVEFAAYYQTDKVGVLRERSRFIRELETWYYIDGEIKRQALPGRNEPCWCGSGKKSKKCHGP